MFIYGCRPESHPENVKNAYFIFKYIIFTFETSYEGKSMYFLIKASNTEDLNSPGRLL